MARAVDQVLAVWVETERVLETLPEDAPERSILQFEVVLLRGMYKRLTTETVPSTVDVLKSSRQTIEQAWLTLIRVQESLKNRPRS